MKNDLKISESEIIDLATKYISKDEIIDFPKSGELFCFLSKEIVSEKSDQAFEFKGYGICLQYTYDTESKPIGKWIWFKFLSLQTFPPVEALIRLQPPHIAKGLYSTSDHSAEIQIIKIKSDQEDLQKYVNGYNPPKKKQKQSILDIDTKLLKFPKLQ